MCNLPHHTVSSICTSAGVRFIPPVLLVLRKNAELVDLVISLSVMRARFALQYRSRVIRLANTSPVALLLIQYIPRATRSQVPLFTWISKYARAANVLKLDLISPWCARYIAKMNGCYDWHVDAKKKLSWFEKTGDIHKLKSQDIRVIFLFYLFQFHAVLIFIIFFFFFFSISLTWR